MYGLLVICASKISSDFWFAITAAGRLFAFCISENGKRTITISPFTSPSMLVVPLLCSSH